MGATLPRVEDQDETAIHPAEVTLLDYVVGDLEHERSAEIRRHMAGCSECRNRIAQLSLAMDALDRLPSAGIPHDVLGAVRPPARRAGRIVPIALLVAAGLGVVALFQAGGLQRAEPQATGSQVVLETASERPELVVAELLGGLPHDVVVDRDDGRRIVVLVQAGDVAVAAERLSGTSSPDGRSYVVDVAATPAAP
jgi:anti-sigma factor RsiW